MDAFLHVLIVEDCDDTAVSTAIMLEAWGMAPTIAASGRRAIAEALQSPPDVVLLDLGLPDMDGLDVARTLRQFARLDRTAIIVMTGFATPDDPMRSQAAGCQRHLTKPVHPQHLRLILLDTVNAIAESRMLRQGCERLGSGCRS